MGMIALLERAVALGASDLHLHSGAKMRMRIDGDLRQAGEEVLEPELAERLIAEVLTADQLATLAADQQVDLVLDLPGVARFRSNVYKQQRGMDAVFRIISNEPPTFESLGLPSSFETLTAFHQGLVLFTGPTGCGKSSTMAAAIEVIAHQRAEHILTIEDPVEFVFPLRRALINQRQVGPHTESFGRALRAALREDPDVIVIGELRDLESISLALTAAETGHLVFATLHTTGAVRTINRLLGVFPPDEQPQVRMMLSESLRAIVSQRRVPKIAGGRVVAIELLLGTPAIANLIRDQKTFQIQSVMQTSLESGMCLLDHSLARLVKQKVVTLEVARTFAAEPDKLVAPA
jgi:twitching motility protein PilT